MLLQFQEPFLVRSWSVPRPFLTRSYFCSLYIPPSFWVWVLYGGRRLGCDWQSSYMDCTTGWDACGIAYAMWTWAQTIVHPPTPGRVPHARGLLGCRLQLAALQVITLGNGYNAMCCGAPPWRIAAPVLGRHLYTPTHVQIVRLNTQ